MAELISRVDDALARGASPEPDPMPTGFAALDEAIGGGLRAGDLALLGGAHGVGKTTWALQVARNVAAAGREVIYVCFEETPQDLLTRMICREIALYAGEEDGISIGQVRRSLRAGTETADLLSRLHRYRGAPEALDSIAEWSGRLRVCTPESREFDLNTLRTAIADDGCELVVVDYLQKVAPERVGMTERDHVTAVCTGLKDAAKAVGACVLALVAAEMAALAPGHRLRTHELRGSSALAYEPDLIMIMDEKYEVVARHHLVYDSAGAQRYHDYVMLTIEKNRSGPAGLRLDLRKRLAQGHFAVDASITREEVIDDRIYA